MIIGAAYSNVIVVISSLRALFSIFAFARRRWNPAGTARIASLVARIAAGLFSISFLASLTVSSRSLSFGYEKFTKPISLAFLPSNGSPVMA